jgi:DNA-binding transcriptional ArsR family regulator
VTPRSRKKPQPVVLDDARSIKALTHPARLAVIDELYSGRELTATECAEIVGLSPSAMSYHLRALERFGIVTRAEAGQDGRERPWRAAGNSVTVTAAAAGSRIAHAASAALATSVLRRLGDRFGAWLDRSAEESEPWQEASGISSATLWLTLEEAQQVERELEQIVARYRGRATSKRPAGARRVSLDILMFPLDVPTDQH